MSQARPLSLRDAPGTSREYETVYVLRPNTANDGVAEVNAKVKAVIEGMGGKVLKVDNWGKRRLAYEVAKERKGIYLYWRYLATSGVVEEAERNLRMLDSVIRFLTIRVDENVVADARPTEVDDTAYERAATTAADEEDLFLSRPAGEPQSDEDEYGGFEDGDVVPGQSPSVEKEN
ncbi:MAG TPA: 30S ribosomal protein S6 [Kofleriaceae bacterium]|nr:30S ribosomal protein S6 [Kofleriaceae bacterium]